MATVRTWIISMHNSEDCGAGMFRKFGDEYDIKKQLVKMVKEAGKDHEDHLQRHLRQRPEGREPAMLRQ